MREVKEIEIALKRSRKNGVTGASTVLMVKKSTYRYKRYKHRARYRWKKSYWLITLYYGKRACKFTSYLKKIPGRKRRKRYLNIHRYIKCLNHEIMHAVLHDVIGELAFDQWDNIIKTNDGWRYQGKRYGGKNIIGGHLPCIYCVEE